MILKKENTVPLSVPGMDEPVKKKQKLREVRCHESGNEDLELLQHNLLNQCLCSMSESCLRKPFQGMKLVSEKDIQGYRHTVVAEWNRNRTLQFVSCVQLLCETAIKQNSKGLLCSRIGDVCDAFVRNEYGLVDHLIELADHADRFVCFVAGRALSAFFLVSRAHVNPIWLDKLTDSALTESPQKVSYSLEVFKRIIEWKDCDEHPLEQRGEADHVSSCHVLSVSEPEILDSSQIKCLCIKALENKWPSIVTRFDSLISSYSPEYEGTIITFLGLWEMIITVKENKSVIDTKPFHEHIDSFVPLLNSGIPPIIWKHLMGLFNEVLCYGSTLALQEILDDEPCALAHLVVRSVKDWRLLDSLPYRVSGGGFVGGTGDGDRPLLQKAVLLVLKAVAVTVKETRSDSSSDSSECSETDDADADMALIERSIREVLRQLDLCVKSLLPYHPETPVAEWVVTLFTDQDDALIEAMVSCLDVTVGLCFRETTLPDLRRILNPVVTFMNFLHTVSHDPDVLLDLLVSNETCFLLYLLRMLKYIRRNWNEFVTICAQNIDDTMGVLIRLRLAIDRLVSKDLFPYNINPVLRLLEKCENLYEGSSGS